MQQKLIFFVDDDKMILNLLEYIFRSKEEFIIKTFDSGEKCLEHLSMNPDLIVLDHFFTNNKNSLTGLETLEKILAEKPYMKVVMLSSQDNEKLIPEFINKGAKKYIAKDSYFIDSLMDTIDTLFL